jgi:hypothetical protein
MKHSKNIINMEPPGILFDGTNFGDKALNPDWKMFVWDFSGENDLFCEVEFNPDKKGFFSIGK